MSIEIMQATLYDVSEIGSLFDYLNDHLEDTINYPGWKKGVYPTREHAQADIAAKTLFVARHQDRIVGTIVINQEPIKAPVNCSWMVNASDDEVVAMHRLAVHPDYMRSGIGTQLLHFAERQANDKGMKAIRLDVYEGNLAAIRAYEKCGYMHIDTVDIGLGHYGLDWFRLYEKPLFGICSLLKDHLPVYAMIIRASFATVATQWSFTMDNCPSHTSFITDEQLTESYSDGYHPFGYFTHGKMIGFASLTNTGQGVFKLKHVSVLPEYRHLGVGKSILDFCKDKVRQWGGIKIMIGIMEENTVLKNWYEYNGFRHTGVEIIANLPFTVGHMEWDVE